MKSLLICSLAFPFLVSIAFAQSPTPFSGAQSAAGGLGSLIKPAPPPVASDQEIKKTITPLTVPPTTPPTPLPPSEVKPPTGTYAEYLYFEKACKPNQPDMCLQAGKIMIAEKPPQEIFNMNSTTRINRAIRFFENAIAAGSLEAMELAYDLYYNSNLALREINSYTDKQRAKELSDLMIAKDYAGGQIRLAKEYIENPEYLLSFGKKKEACQIVKKLNAKNDLTDSTKKILDDLNSGVICKIAG